VKQIKAHSEYYEVENKRAPLDHAQAKFYLSSRKVPARLLYSVQMKRRPDDYTHEKDGAANGLGKSEKFYYRIHGINS